MQHFKRQTFNWVISGSNSDNQFTWHFLLEALEKKQRRNDQQRENVGYQLSASVTGRRKKTTSPTQYRHIRGSQMQFHSQLTLTWDQSDASRAAPGLSQYIPLSFLTLFITPKRCTLRYQIFWCTIPEELWYFHLICTTGRKVQLKGQDPPSART